MCFLTTNRQETLSTDGCGYLWVSSGLVINNNNRLHSKDKPTNPLYTPSRVSNILHVNNKNKILFPHIGVISKKVGYAVSKPTDIETSGLVVGYHWVSKPTDIENHWVSKHKSLWGY